MLVNEYLTYNIPGVSEIRIGPHDKAHCNDFKDHFTCVNNKKDEIDLFHILGDNIYFLVQGQEETIENNYK